MINTNDIDNSSISMAGVDTGDYPDFVDAYIECAALKSGRVLTETELNWLSDNEAGYVQEQAMESIF